MNFEARHIALLDAGGVYDVRCVGKKHSDCWQYEDENGVLVMGEECQIALWLNESDLSISGHIMVLLEIDGWSEDGVDAHMVGCLPITKQLARGIEEAPHG